MDYIYHDRLIELNRQKIQRDQAFILKEEMLKPRSGLTYLLNLLGNWMIKTGEKLRRQYSFSPQVRKLDSLQDASRIFKA